MKSGTEVPESRYSQAMWGRTKILLWGPEKPLCEFGKGKLKVDIDPRMLEGQGPWNVYQ